MAMKTGQLGIWAFLLGVIIAILAGVAKTMVAVYAGYITLILVILGLIVGFLNIGDKEIDKFLIAAIALVIVGNLSNLGSINAVINPLGTMLIDIVQNIAVFVAPAVLVVSLKAVYRLGSTAA